MKNQKRLTVTVGIPAYNEAENIAYLLRSILKQKQKTYRLEKIIVVCDGCTDNTAEIVRRLAKKNPLIKLIDDKKRVGKAQRLNQLYQLNTSDIIITLDGDIILSAPETLETLLRGFGDEKVVVVTGNNQPIKAETFIERVYNAGYRMWYEIRKDYQRGDHIHNINGMMVALRNSFAKSFIYPKNTFVSDSGFVFMKAKLQKSGFRFVKNAVGFFRSVDNLKDFFSQATRNIHEKSTLVKYFGNQIYEEYRIPHIYKIKGVMKMLCLDPIFTSFAILLNILLRIFPARQDLLYKQGVWKIAKSTKRGIK